MLGVARAPIAARAHVNPLALALATAVMIVGLAALAPARAHAISGCGDSWTNTAGGSWFEGSNWSKGAAPTSEESACITAEGTYTVTMTQTSPVTVGSLTVGGASGKQKLVVGSSCSTHAVLTAGGGITNNANGAIVMTNGDSCGDNVTLVAPITNAGTITSEPEHGGERAIQGSLTNTGTLAINTTTFYNGAAAALSNQGVIQLAEAKSLDVTGSASVANETGGSIVATGSGSISTGAGTSFTEAAGTTSGSLPVIVDDGSLDYTGSGASVIALRGAGSLAGKSSSGQTLSLQSTCTENAKITAASGFANGGTLAMTNGDSCGNNVTIAIPSGVLANSGKIAIENLHGGERTIEGSLTNTGTLAVNANTSFDGKSAALTNEGAIDVAENRALSLSKAASFTNGAGGSIVATGNGSVSLGSGTTFNEDAGTTSGAKPVIVDDATLNYGEGGGSSLIAMHGSSSLGGSLAAGQSLSIESTCSEHALTTATASFANAGTITLTNGDSCGNNATLVLSGGGTLTNSGRLATEPVHGGERTIQANVTNTGTLAIKANTEYNGASTKLINEGTLSVAEALQLKVSKNSSVTNGAGGKIVTSGGSAVTLSGGTFFEGAGTTSGAKPVIVDDGTLDYTGEGKSVIALHGASTLQGVLATGQALSIESTCSEHAVVTAPENVTNGGTIVLTNGDSCGNNATLATAAASTLTNTGQILTEVVHGGERALQGNFTNKGTITIDANTRDSTSGAAIKNEGAIDIAETITFSVTGPGTVTNGTGGTIAGGNSGVFAQTGGTFNEANGASTGNQPVILDDLTLNYSEHGSGPIQVRGTSTMTGAVRAGQTLQIASTCGEHAVLTAGSFTNNGTIELTNGDSCGDNATLNMKGGTLTNHEKLVAVELHGGVRTIEGNLVNQALLRLEAGQTLHVTGNFSQTSIGRVKTLIASASSFGSLAVTGSATLAGALVLRQVEPFKATLGQTFAIVAGGSIGGKFETESEDQINSSGLYYKPTYSATGVTLAVTQATQSPSPATGAPSSMVVVSGSGWLPGDTVTVRFTDRKGTQTFFAPATVNEAGEFSSEITVPAGAGAGEAQVHVTSTQTGVHINKSFTVS